MDIHDHVFGEATGLETKRPVADAGGNDEIRTEPPFVAVGAAVFPDPYPHSTDGDELSAMGVAAQNQVRTRLRFGVKIMGLMVEEQDIPAPIRKCPQEILC